MNGNLFQHIDMLLFGSGVLNLPTTMARHALNEMGAFGDEYATALVADCAKLLTQKQRQDLTDAMKRIENAQNELAELQADQDQNGQADQDQNGQADQDQNGQADQDQNGQGLAIGSDTIYESALDEISRKKLKLNLAIEALDELRDDCLSVDCNMQHASLQGVQDLAPMLEELGWKPNRSVVELMKLIKSMDFKLGKGKPSRQYRRLDGVQPNEASHIRALGCASEFIRTRHILEGRTCIEQQYGGLYTNLVIDTSGSMGGQRLQNAKAMLGSFYLAMAEDERHQCRVFQYNNSCTEIDMETVPKLIANGGTNLAKLTPYLREAHKNERWIVVTDGHLPNMDTFESEKLAIISLDKNHPDPRVALYREGCIGDHVNVERLFRRILK